MGPSHKTVRVVVIAAAALGAGMVLPAACLFPDYTFDLNGTGGAGGASSSSSSSTSTSSTGSTSSSGSTGGGGSSSSSSSSTSSGSSGSTCTTVDCSDPKCQPDYGCVNAAPTGWQGYFSLYDGPAAGDPGCGGLYPTSLFVGNSQLSAAQASCSACTCSNPQGETCEVPTVRIADAPCGQGYACYRILDAPPAGWVPGTCYGTDGAKAGDTKCGPNSNGCTAGTQACNQSLRPDPAKVTGGTCTPSQQIPTVNPIGWGIAGEACGGAAMVTAGCNAGQACLPKPKAPFQQGVCIMKDGDNACPPGQFSQKHLLYAGAADTRTCSTCTCDAPVGSTCSASIEVYSSPFQNDCTSGPLLATVPSGGCADTPSNPEIGSRKATTTPPTGGSCAPSGGQPTGTATPQSPTTFCCIP